MQFDEESLGNSQEELQLVSFGWSTLEKNSLGSAVMETHSELSMDTCSVWYSQPDMAGKLQVTWHKA